MVDTEWAELTAAERYERRMRAWQEPEGVEFARPRLRQPTPSVPA